jgi:purine-binding chemotaxis protein CheW
MSNMGVGFNRKEKAAATLVEMCSVRLGTTLFGVPIKHILEIVGGARPQPVPLAPRFVGGLVHYRGDVLTTVSLRQLLDLPPRDGPQDILVLESSGGCFGLLVDSVGEVLTVSSLDYEPNPSILDERRRALFVGAYKLKDSLMIMLDPERLDPVRLDPVLLEGTQHDRAQTETMRGPAAQAA